MLLHVFNPEHDIALARNDAFFTPPRAARVLRDDLAWLPQLWADEGDGVLVGEHVLPGGGRTHGSAPTDYLFLTANNASLSTINYKLQTINYKLQTPHSSLKISPWGWDRALVRRLVRLGVPREAMPTDGELDVIRQLSSRETAARLLPRLVAEDARYVGEMRVLRSVDELPDGDCVLKEPWSCSGRGVRFLRASATEAERNWARRVIGQQGGIMAEPIYNKVVDFGMEFWVSSEEGATRGQRPPERRAPRGQLAQGGVAYRGLSVFTTTGSAYDGSLVASEEEKAATLAPYVSEGELLRLRERLCALLTPLLQGRYEGPLGIDMMVVREPGALRLHPLVEMNLRRTMGHVAIDLYERGHRGTMRIAYEGGHYQFSVK